MYAVIKFDADRQTATSIHNTEVAAWKRALKRAARRAQKLGVTVEKLIDGFSVETAVYRVLPVTIAV